MVFLLDAETLVLAIHRRAVIMLSLESITMTVTPTTPTTAQTNPRATIDSAMPSRQKHGRCT